MLTTFSVPAEQEKNDTLSLTYTVGDHMLNVKTIHSVCRHHLCINVCTCEPFAKSGIRVFFALSLLPAHALQFAFIYSMSRRGTYMLCTEHVMCWSQNENWDQKSSDSGFPQ